MKIVLLGKLRSGKSHAAKLFIEAAKDHLGIELARKPLAAPIYKAAQRFYRETGLVWRKNRRLLEGMGEAMNEDYPGGDLIVQFYKEKFNPSENIIVEDCRRLTQAKFLRDNGAFFVRIKCSDEIRKERCLYGEWTEGHVTDTELDDYPCHANIDNTLTLDYLKTQVVDITKEFITEAT